MAQRRPKPIAEAAAEAARVGEHRTRAKRGRPPGRASDVFGGELRRRDVFPLLVLHLIEREPSFGNRLIEEIEEISGGMISVNPNTMYPLLRDLESEGKIEGRWEHPDKRTRRFYAITDEGRAELERLRVELEPFLETMARTIRLIRNELYG
jgi:DNA-binding PadR family transcriptional regulator